MKRHSARRVSTPLEDSSITILKHMAIPPLPPSSTDASAAASGVVSSSSTSTTSKASSGSGDGQSVVLSAQPVRVMGGLTKKGQPAQVI